MLIDELSGLPVSNISTDENGAYIFSDVAVGDYSLYVDIPGIKQNTTHYFSITESELEKMDLCVVGDRIKLDLYGFAPGNYIVRQKIENEVQFKKIIVLKQ